MKVLYNKKRLSIVLGIQIVLGIVSVILQYIGLGNYTCKSFMEKDFMEKDPLLLFFCFYVITISCSIIQSFNSNIFNLSILTMCSALSCIFFLVQLVDACEIYVCTKTKMDLSMNDTIVTTLHIVFIICTDAMGCIVAIISSSLCIRQIYYRVNKKLEESSVLSSPDPSRHRSNSVDTVATQVEQYDVINENENKDDTVATQVEQYEVVDENEIKDDTVATQVDQYEVANENENKDDTVVTQVDQYEVANENENKDDTVVTQVEQDEVANENENKDDTVATQVEKYEVVYENENKDDTVATQVGKYEVVDENENKDDTVATQVELYEVVDEKEDDTVSTQVEQYEVVDENEKEDDTVSTQVEQDKVVDENEKEDDTVKENHEINIIVQRMQQVLQDEIAEKCLIRGPIYQSLPPRFQRPNFGHH